MDALLVTGGEGPPRAVLAERLSTFGLVCAADSGLDLLRAWGLEPSLVIGDMDSLSDPGILGLYPRAEIIRLSRAKDDSDTEAGLALLSARGAERIILAGGGEGRLDHLLAIRAIFERPLRPVEWYTAREDIFLVQGGQSIDLPARLGQTISVFPLGAGARGMESEGLRWALGGLVWGRGDYGLSNEATAERVWVGAGEGDLLVVRLRGR